MTIHGISNHVARQIVQTARLLTKDGNEEEKIRYIEELFDKAIYTEILYSLSRDDANEIARSRGLQRKLTDEEFHSVKKAIEWGFGEVWVDIIECALDNIDTVPNNL